MKIPKKKLKQLSHISFMDEIIRNQSLVDNKFTEGAPDTWDKDETKLFDMLAELEYKIKDEVIKVLTENEKKN